MRRKNYLAILSLLIIVLFIGTATSVHAVKAGGGKIKPILKKGDYFPEVILNAPATSEDSAYLGTAEGQPFKISDIKADLVVVEVGSVFCGVCQKMADVFNEVYSLIETNPETKGRIKMIGIFIGDIPSDIKLFREGLKVLYPIVPDEKFDVHKEVGNKYTPFTVFVRQNSNGKPGIVVKTHELPNHDYKDFYEEIVGLLKMDISNIRKADNR